MMDDRDLGTLRGDAWFAGIPPAAQAALLHRTRTTDLRAGARVYSAGDSPNGLWTVLVGQVRLKGYSADGVELLALILRPGTWFGELSMLDGGPRPHDAVAFEDSRLATVSAAALDGAVLAEPSLYRHLALLACRHQRTALDFIVRTVTQPVRNRLAGALARALGDDDARVHIRQEDLAAMVGISRQALSRHLKALERAGLIELGYGQLRVLDRQRLSAIEHG